MFRKALLFALLSLPVTTFAVNVADDPWPCPECPKDKVVAVALADDPWPCPECPKDKLS